MTTVIHVKDMRPGDVYIGRSNPRRGLKNTGWGNPFAMKDKTEQERDRVIKEYREWIQNQPDLLARLPELKGKRLACWCKPEACHGDVLAELADQAE